MTTIEAPMSADDLTEDMLAEMKKYGITRFPIYHFRFGEYTYSSLGYAIAQAERKRGAK